MHNPLGVASNSSPVFQLGHRPALDGLRAVAFLAVFLSHLRVPYPRGGSFGVDIFFVLSGFLITYLLCNERDRTGDINLGSFYKRRAVRLYPALLTMCVFLLAYYRVTGLSKPAWSDSVKRVSVALLYLTNLYAAFDLMSCGNLLHTWSLACEEQYYLLWPLLLCVMIHLKVSRVVMIGVALFLIVLGTSFRAWYWHSHQSDLRIYYSIDSHSDGLLMGSILGILANSNYLPTGQGPLRVLAALAWLAVLFIMVVVVCGASGAYTWYGLLSVVNLSACIIIAAIVCIPEGRIARVLENPLLCWMGRISYGLYLWHYPFVCHYWSSPTFRRIVLVSVLTFSTSALSFYLVERPLLRLKGRQKKLVLLGSNV